MPYHYYKPRGSDECVTYIQNESSRRGNHHRFITEKQVFARWAKRYNITFTHPTWWQDFCENHGEISQKPEWKKVLRAGLYCNTLPPPPRMDPQIATWSMIATFRNWHKKLLGKKTLLLHQMTEVSGNVFCCRRGQNLSFERFVCVYSTDGSCLTSIFCK